jgi:transposase InsO family protein
VATISRGTKAEKFQFVALHKGRVGVKTLCQSLGVSRSGYYDWTHREESNHKKKDKQLLSHIKPIFDKSRCTYGSPKVHRELRHIGILVSRKRVARLMREAGLRARITRSYPKKPINRALFYITENLRLKNKSTTQINTHWSTDLTYIPFGKAWLYLVVILDLHSRRIVGWSLGKSKNSALVKCAVSHAVRKRNPSKGLVLHSDRGSEFRSADLREYTEKFGIVRSMSRPYKSIDNAEIESFFQKLKGEYIIGKNYSTQKELRKHIASYIDQFYNPIRMHSSLGYVSPMKFEAMHA